MSWQPRNKRITPVVAVGTPSAGYSYEEWSTVEVHFHSFEDLPSEAEQSVRSPEFTCFRRRWRLEIFPGGDEFSDDGKVALCLTHLSIGTIELSYRFSIKDDEGKQTANSSEGKEWKATDLFKSARGDPDGVSYSVSNFMRRSKILDLLVGGDTLIVEVRMKQIEATNTPVPQFIPENPLRANILKKFMDEESADVTIEIVAGNGERNRRGARKKAKTTLATFHAHRLILGEGAPALAEFCKSSTKTSPIQIAGVKPEIFRHMLCYVYGGGVFEEELKEHAKDIIEACDKYGVVNLKLEAEACYARTITLTVQNVLDNLLYADAKNCAVLKETVIDYIVENGRDILGKVSFDNVPGGMMTDLLTAVTRGKESDVENSNNRDYETMRVSTLRKKLKEKGLDIDGSRETMIARLKENS